MGQNTRTKSLSDLPSIPVISEMVIFWLHCYIIGILVKFGKTTFSSKSCTPSSIFQKRHGQNDRRKRGNISCVWSKTRFAIVKMHQICTFDGGSPYFPICCLINSFFHEQLLRQSVLIFFIYASFPNHCPPLSTTSHHYPPLATTIHHYIHHYPPLSTTIHH